MADKTTIQIDETNREFLRKISEWLKSQDQFKRAASANDAITYFRTEIKKLPVKGETNAN